MNNFKLDEKVKTNLLKNPYNYASKITIKELEFILRRLSLSYYNTGKSELTDEIFDIIKEVLKKRDPKNLFLKEVGAPISKEKVRLPYNMASLDKIKPDTGELEKWMKKYPGPYIMSDKLDGVSGLLHFKNSTLKLYTRGDGYKGQDISYLIPYIIDEKIQKKVVKKEIVFRGELIISKKKFKTVEDQFKNARNAIAGLVNSKRFSIKLASLTDFVAYSVVYPRHTQENQMKIIKEFNLDCVNYKSKKVISNDSLSEYLKLRRKKGKYDIDGIVVFDSSSIHEFKTGNPKFAFAFKTILSDQVAEVIVRNVNWEISMNGYYKPTVMIEPVKLVGVTISNVTAHNAKFINDNKIGPGSVIQIIRSGDVIPKIEKILKTSASGKPQMPDLPFIWNETKVDIIAKDINSDQMKNVKDSIKIKQMNHFFAGIGALHISEGILRKLYNSGYKTITKILTANPKEVSKIDGIGTRLINKILLSINNAIKETNLADFMASSHKFGRGFGAKRIKLILDKFPNILAKEWTNKEIIANLITIDGFEIKTASQFAKNLNEFKKFYKDINKIVKLSFNKKRSKEKKLREFISRSSYSFHWFSLYRTKKIYRR